MDLNDFFNIILSVPLTKRKNRLSGCFGEDFSLARLIFNLDEAESCELCVCVSVLCYRLVNNWHY